MCDGIKKIHIALFSPLPAKPKGTISLSSVCPSVCLSVCLSVRPSVCHSIFSFPDFSLQWMKIFNWNLIYDYISVSYRPSLSFVMLDQLLTELLPLMFTISFPDFFLPWMKWGIRNFLYCFFLNSCRSSSRFSTFDLFFTEFWPFINCDI